MVSISDVNWKTNPEAATLPEIGVGDIAVLKGVLEGVCSLHFKTMVDSAESEYLSLTIQEIYEWNSKTPLTSGTHILELRGEKINCAREYVFDVNKAKLAS